MSPKILITGAGGPAAVAFIKAVAHLDIELHGADMDPYAAGLYLLPEPCRHLLPCGSASHYVDAVVALALQRGIQVIVPTVDEELIPLARARRRLRRCGVELLCAGVDALSICLDKQALIERCRGRVPVPRSEVYDESFDAERWDWSSALMVKPRRGRGSRGIQRIERPEELAALPRDGSLLLQELLPGEEYSVDVFVNARGDVEAAVPRQRQRVRSGVAVVSRTLFDVELQQIASHIARLAGIVGVCNVQLKRDVRGRPALLEVNPRFPGTMSLTVAAGVNMPALALQTALGHTPTISGCFREVVMVRHLEERFASPQAVSELMQRGSHRYAEERLPRSAAGCIGEPRLTGLCGPIRAPAQP